MLSIDVFEDYKNHFNRLRESIGDYSLISRNAFGPKSDFSDSTNQLETQLSSEYLLGMIMEGQFVFAELNCQSGSTVSKRIWIIL